MTPGTPLERSGAKFWSFFASKPRPDLLWRPIWWPKGVIWGPLGFRAALAHPWPVQARLVQARPCPGQACPGQALSRPGLVQARPVSVDQTHSLCGNHTVPCAGGRAGRAGGRADSRKVWTCWFLHPPLILHTPKIAFPPLRGIMYQLLFDDLLGFCSILFNFVLCFVSIAPSVQT